MTHQEKEKKADKPLWNLLIRAHHESDWHGGYLVPFARRISRFEPDPLKLSDILKILSMQTLAYILL